VWDPIWLPPKVSPAVDRLLARFRVAAKFPPYDVLVRKSAAPRAPSASRDADGVLGAVFHRVHRSVGGPEERLGVTRVVGEGSDADARRDRRDVDLRPLER